MITNNLEIGKVYTYYRLQGEKDGKPVGVNIGIRYEGKVISNGTTHYNFYDTKWKILFRFSENSLQYVSEQREKEINMLEAINYAQWQMYETYENLDDLIDTSTHEIRECYKNDYEYFINNYYLKKEVDDQEKEIKLY
jgi:hypothetical protein